MFWIIELIGLILLYIIVLGLSIIIHEFGHKHLLTKYKGHDVKIKFKYKSVKDFGFEAGQVRDYIFLNRSQLLSVYSVGVLSGLAVILMAMVLFPILPLWMLLIPYILGCRSDIKQIYIILRKRNLGWEY